LVQKITGIKNCSVLVVNDGTTSVYFAQKTGAGFELKTGESIVFNGPNNAQYFNAVNGVSMRYWVIPDGNIEY